MLLLTSGTGAVYIHAAAAASEGGSRWEWVHKVSAHTANVFCVQLDPLARYMATASADSMIGLWDMREWMSVRMSAALAFPARSLSFSHDGEFLAAGGEDPFIDIVSYPPLHCTADTRLTPGAQSSTATGNTVHKIPVSGMINTLAWHPSKLMLAYAGDDAPTTTTGSAQPNTGVIRIFGL